MSMISSLIDELRNAAEFYDGFKAADLMCEAADTIWQLRDDLQRANAENAKLREYVEAAAIHSYKGGVWCDKCTFRSQCYGDEPKEHQGRGCQWLLWAHELGVEVTDGD